MTYILEVCAVLLGLLVGVTAASAEYFRERDRRLKWTIALATALSTALVGFGVLAARYRKDLEETKQANLEKRALNRTLNQTLHRISTVQTVVETEASSLTKLSRASDSLNAKLGVAGATIARVDSQAGALSSQIQRQAAEVRSQADLTTLGVENTRRLLYPIDRLFIRVRIGYSLSDPDIQPYAFRIRRTADSMMAEYPDSHSVGSNQLNLWWGPRGRNLTVDVTANTPYFPQPRVASETKAAHELGDIALTVWAFPLPQRNTGKDGHSASVAFSVGGAVDSTWPGLIPRLVPRERFQYLPSLRLDYDADSLYVEFTSRMQEEARFSNVIQGLYDLYGTEFEILAGCAVMHRCRPQELIFTYGGNSILVEDRAIIRKDDFWIHRFTRAEVDALVGRPALTLRRRTPIPQNKPMTRRPHG